MSKYYHDHMQELTSGNMAGSLLTTARQGREGKFGEMVGHFV